jgi:hypothetical protein
MIERQGWHDLRVVKEHSARYVVHRVVEAFTRRGFDHRSLRRRDCA